MLVALLLVHSAAANPKYPAIVYNHLGLDVAPACTLCHATNDGQKGTVVKPFGIWMYDNGLRGDSTEQELIDLLDQNDTDEVDVDGDGVGDIDELRDGTDPNVAGSTLSAPKYGCLSTTSGATPTALLGLAALGLVFRRRRAH